MDRAGRYVAILLPSLSGGGAERTILKLAGGFCSRGYKVDLVLVHKSGPLLNEIPSLVRVVDLRAMRNLSSRAFSSLPTLINYLRSAQPEILFTGLMTNLIAIWAVKIARVPTKVVISERNILSAEIRQHPKDLRFRLLPFLVKIFYPWADGIVAVSQAVAQDLNQLTGISIDKINVIYNPVITLRLKEKANGSCDHPWLSEGQLPVILSVGRLTAQKDYPTLLAAFARVRQSMQVRMIILGEGEERTHLEELSKQLKIKNDVLFPGFIENPYPWMKRASLFVHSAKYEGLPGVIIEALYCGVPVIATDCQGGTREILANGHYGQLIPVGDPGSLAKNIIDSLNVRPPTPPDDCWKEFESERIIDQYAQLFEQICGKDKNDVIGEVR